MNRARPTRLLVALSLTACWAFSTVAAGNAAAPQAVGGVLRQVHQAADFRFPAGFSSGGEFGISSDASWLDARLVSMSDGTVIPISLRRPVPTANGAFVFGNPDDQTIERFAVGSGLTTTRTVPFDDVGATWQIIDSVADGDGSGRFVLFRASSAGLGRTAVFLYDFETDTLVRSNGHAISGDVTNAIPETISLDGNIVVYRELRGAVSTTVRWDRATDVRTGFGPEGDVVTRGGDVSPDFEWEVFTSSAVEIAPGVDDGLRYYRRNLVTGWIGVVDVDPDEVLQADIYAGGRVVIRVRTPTPREGDPTGTADQLFVSDPGRPTRLLSLLPDGSPAPGGVWFQYAPNVDATAIAFASFGPELTTGDGDDVWRWYVAEIAPRIDSVDGSAAATASAVRCSRSDTC